MSHSPIAYSTENYFSFNTSTDLFVNDEATHSSVSYYKEESNYTPCGASLRYDFDVIVGLKSGDNEVKMVTQNSVWLRIEKYIKGLTDKYIADGEIVLLVDDLKESMYMIDDWKEVQFVIGLNDGVISKGRDIFPIVESLSR